MFEELVIALLVQMIIESAKLTLVPAIAWFARQLKNWK